MIRTALPEEGAQAPNIDLPALMSVTMADPGPAAGAIVSAGSMLIVLPRPFSTESKM
jgi:hypothetical protein